MVSTIYQISEKPINKERKIQLSRYKKSGFIGYIADHIYTKANLDENYDLNNDIEELKRELEGVAVFEGNKFTITNKEAYFVKKYEAWKQVIADLGKIDLKTFANTKDNSDSGYSNLMLLCGVAEWSYNNKYGTYVDRIEMDYFGNETFDAFIRLSKNGDVWYVENAIYYAW